MDTTKQPVPREAIDAYNLFIHGNIDRRAFLDRVKKVAVSTAAAAAIVDQLMPNYAAAQQVSPTDPRIKTERATVPSPNGNGKITGLLVRPVSAGTNRLPAILVIHENRGLNPHIEDVARRIALENFMTFAPDGLTPRYVRRGGHALVTYTVFNGATPHVRVMDPLPAIEGAFR